MKKEFIVERSGKNFVLYAGLLDMAHEQGLKSIRTDLIQVPNENNNRVAICGCTVVMEKEGVERVFTGIGDAAPNNVAPAMQTCLIRMAECVSLSAKALTRTGWKTHDELVIGEDILAYDLKTDTCKWTPLRDVSVFRGEYDTIEMSGRSFRAVCTPNHKWVSAFPRCQIRLRALDEMPANDNILVAAPAEGGSNPLTPRDAAIFGWLITDGSINKYMVGKNGPYTRCVISQSKPEQVELLRKLLGDDAHEYTAPEYDRTFPNGKTYHCRRSYKFELRAEFARELLAKVDFTTYNNLIPLITSLSVEAREAMLEAMLLADGSKSAASGTWTFAKKAKPGIMEAFEILATLNGSALGIPQVIKSCDMPARTLRVNRKISRQYIKEIKGEKQSVWCPTTDFGTWVMNYEGTITITGNTRSKARALRDAVNVGVAALEELGDNDVSDGAGQYEERGTPVRRQTRRPPLVSNSSPSTSEGTNLSVNKTDKPCPECYAPPGKVHIKGCKQSQGLT